MPWPATHILIAEKVFDRYFSHLNHAHFILGTCFPDIRYPAKIERQLTHFDAVTLGEVQSQSAFKAGLSFHSLVDGMWNAYIHEHEVHLFTELPHNRAMFHTLKILQDRYLYSKIHDWQPIVNYFNDTLPEERDFNVNENMLQRWHAMLAHYLGKPPVIDDLKMLNLSLPAELVGEIESYYRQYQEHPVLKEVMVGFYDQADSLINSA